MAKYGMVIDVGSCIGCGACIAACDFENKTLWEEGKRRTHVPELFLGEYPNVMRLFIPHLCVHCDNPPCVAVCPTGASYINEDGVVLVDGNLCIGCEYCVIACPFNARYIDTRKGVVDKCTFCYDNRILQGKEPACVETCVGGARIFGDLDNPNSKASKFLTSVDKSSVVSVGEMYGLSPKVLYVIPESKEVKEDLINTIGKRSSTLIRSYMDRGYIKVIGEALSGIAILGVLGHLIFWHSKRNEKRKVEEVREVVE